MNDTIHREACSWAELKSRLDPAWSYVVIETTSVTSSVDVFHTDGTEIVNGRAQSNRLRNID